MQIMHSERSSNGLVSINSPVDGDDDDDDEIAYFIACAE